MKKAFVPLALTLVVVMTAWPRLPSRVWDAGTESYATGFDLVYPTGHYLLSPFFMAADRVSTMGLEQTIALLVYLLVLNALWRYLRYRKKGIGPGAKGLIVEAGWLASPLVFFALFLAWAVLVPRPVVRMTAADPEVAFIDTHSHTSMSWDGNKSFGWRENMQWHERLGFDAGFITDHNNIDYSRAAKEHSLGLDVGADYVSLSGEEISLELTHIVTLGNHEPIDNKLWPGPGGVRAFMEWARARGYVVQASLPQYWLYHPGEELEKFFNGGAHGFEIVNCAPTALDFTPSFRRMIVERLKREDLYMVGITDNHGWGFAACAWNAMRIPGWRELDTQGLEDEVLHRLKNVGFEASRVLMPVPWWPENALWLALSPPANLVIMLRTLDAGQRVAWVAWIWLLWLGVGRLRAKLYFD